MIDLNFEDIEDEKFAIYSEYREINREDESVFVIGRNADFEVVMGFLYDEYDQNDEYSPTYLMILPDVNLFDSWYNQDITLKELILETEDKIYFNASCGCQKIKNNKDFRDSQLPGDESYYNLDYNLECFLN